MIFNIAIIHDFGSCRALKMRLPTRRLSNANFACKTPVGIEIRALSNPWKHPNVSKTSIKRIKIAQQKTINIDGPEDPSEHRKSTFTKHQ